MKRKLLLTLLLCSLAGLIFWASGSTKLIPMQPRSYSWSAPSSAMEKNGITFALVAPSYGSEGLGDISFFKDYSKSMEGDFSEMLTQKGYSIRGPYKALDEMVFSDKKDSYLALMVDIAPDIRAVSGGWVPNKKLTCTQTGAKPNMFRGTIRIAGNINLKAVEPLSGETMWTRKVEIPETLTEELESSTSFCEDRIGLLWYQALSQDGALANPVSAALSDAYKDILDKVWKMLDPQEFERLRKDVERLKANE